MDGVKMKKAFIPIAIIFGLLMLAFGFNFISLQLPLNNILKSDQRNKGITAFAYYDFFVIPSSLVFDIWDVKMKSNADIERVFESYAESMVGKKFKIVKLACRGKVKFIIDGLVFNQLGAQYAHDNYMYGVFNITKSLLTPDLLSAFPAISGGWIYETTMQLQQFNEFHALWWKSDD